MEGSLELDTDNQTFRHMTILFTNELLLNPSVAPALFALPSPAACSSNSPIFHARTIERDNAAPMYMKPVNKMAPV